jgi:hypothetical protein
VALFHNNPFSNIWLMTQLRRLALLAGTLDGCVQLLCVRGDEAARTYKSREWYWLDANVNAEYCSTYKDVFDVEAVRSKKPVQTASLAPESVGTETPAAYIRTESSSISKTTVSLPLGPSFYYAKHG